MGSDAAIQTAGRNAPSGEAATEIRPFQPGIDAAAFRALNEEWISFHFILEARDVETLSDPEGSILTKGGHIFMLHVEGKAAGCVALVPMHDGIFELSKMAVAPHLRGRGLGRKILRHAIAQARLFGVRRLFLGSSTKLPDAVHLYETVGFRHVPPEQLPPLPYARASVFMDMVL